MTRRQFIALTTVLCGAIHGSMVLADDITTKNLVIKDNANASKRRLLLLSKDPNVLLSGTDDPSTNGAILHAYSATDDLCAVLPSGANWSNPTGAKWKFHDTTTRNLAIVKSGLLKVVLHTGVNYSLMDNGTQGTVNVQVQFGTGTRFCMRCSGNKRDDATQFHGKDCVAAACDAEPSQCPPTSPTVLKGALLPTTGRFNYTTLGVPGADTACNANFAGTHACSYAELQAAQTAGDLVGLKDVAMNSVTSFWAIDSLAAPLTQCNDDTPMTGSGLNWEYPTAHTLSRGQRVALNNGAGTLGPLQPGVQCNLSGTSSVGCCQ